MAALLSGCRTFTIQRADTRSRLSPAFAHFLNCAKRNVVTEVLNTVAILRKPLPLAE